MTGRVLLASAALLLSACAHGGRPAPAAAPTAAAAGQAPDSVAETLARADAHLEAGRREAAAGHVNLAREEFDRAVEVYLTAPGGAFSNPRLAEAYRRTLESVHLWEIEALAAGDGFAEQQSEPAVIDEVEALEFAGAPASEESRRTAEQAVAAEQNDFPVELNDRVLACIDLYTGRLREWFGAALARGGRYLPRIREILAEEGLPQDLAYLALVESAFKPHALSRAKARGVWQFIPATGRRYGLEQDWWVDERSDPEKATRAAARYLKDLHALFGDWNLAMAGYNAGENKVIRGIKKYDTNDFWELAGTRALRRETKNYVPLIHAAIVVAKAPEKYGFDVLPEAHPAFQTVAVDGAVDLRFISECAGATLETVRQLNPALRRMATPAGRSYDLKVPEGTAAGVAECLASVPPEKRLRFRVHVVARGDTLSGIAGRYGVRTADLASANGIALKKRLSIGMELMVPSEPRAVPERRATARVARSAEPGAGTRIAYRIRRGDTLVGIASQFGTTVRELQSWNRLRGSRITAGDTLTVYATRGF
jgi:membrane-bound lytic murein transglycosylase D